MDYTNVSVISRSLSTESGSIDTVSCNAIEPVRNLSSSKLAASKIANKIVAANFPLRHQPCSSQQQEPYFIGEHLSKTTGELTKTQNTSDASGETKNDSETELSSVPQSSTSCASSGEHNESLYQYYRIIYRGVVGLLSAPNETSPRSGTYLSYGEIFGTRKNTELKEENYQIPASDRLENNGNLTQTQQPDFVSKHQIDKSNVNLSQINFTGERSKFSGLPSEIALRVDIILTGGYATDGSACYYDTDVDADTPKRSNVVDYSIKHPLTDPERVYGYIFPGKRNVTIVEPLETKPLVDVGTFWYKIVSSSPIPVLTGPCTDAPKTRAILLPDSVVEVSLRVCFDVEIRKPFFLRLSHRRGWIPDHIYSAGKRSLVAMEISNNSIASLDGQNIQGLLASPSFQSSLHRRRHKPPRRLQADNRSEVSSDALSQNHLVGQLQTMRHKPNVPSMLHSERLATPCSNVSILSDDSSLDTTTNNRQTLPNSPETSFSTANSATSTRSKSGTQSYFFLMRVCSAEGLRILDAPQFQVNNLIRGKQNGSYYSVHHGTAAGSTLSPNKINSSIFQTMTSRLAPPAPGITLNAVTIDATSKMRILPFGSLFEASTRMEKTGAFKLGIGLIKLSDNSGWAIVPHPHYERGATAEQEERECARSFEEVGSAVVYSCHGHLMEKNETVGQHWIRVVTRGGVHVYCAVSNGGTKDDETSPSSSKGSSALSGSMVGSAVPPETSSDSDIASSVGSAFLDALFRTPKKVANEGSLDRQAIHNPGNNATGSASHPTIACGCFVEIEPKTKSVSTKPIKEEFVRIKGGQGWLPLSVGGKITAISTPRPDIKYGSYWYRVRSLHGIKVRSGPSRKAQSIKSEHGVHFRFECGEFLRVSEVVTAFSNDGKAIECFAKLYRHRHVQLQQPGADFVPLAYLSAQSEWVEIFRENEQYLTECDAEPRIERHQQGWRYNVVPDNGIEVRKGPSFSSEKTGIILFGGESIVINERVYSPDEGITWLRMKDGNGWVYDFDGEGNGTMIPHSLRYRTKFSGSPKKADMGKEVAYDAIIARLFHNTERLDRDHQVTLNPED